MRRKKRECNKHRTAPSTACIVWRQPRMAPSTACHVPRPSHPPTHPCPKNKKKENVHIAAIGGHHEDRGAFGASAGIEVDPFTCNQHLVNHVGALGVRPRQHRPPFAARGGVCLPPQRACVQLSCQSVVEMTGDGMPRFATLRHAVNHRDPAHTRTRARCSKNRHLCTPLLYRAQTFRTRTHTHAHTRTHTRARSLTRIHTKREARPRAHRGR